MKRMWCCHFGLKARQLLAFPHPPTRARRLSGPWRGGEGRGRGNTSTPWHLQLPAKRREGRSVEWSLPRPRLMGKSPKRVGVFPVGGA